MKYFTKELWLGFSDESDSNESFRRTDEQWRRNVDAYKKQLRDVTPRLSKRAAKFFTSISLHDGRLLSFGVGDGLEFDASRGETFDRNSRRTSVLMNVLTFEQDFLFKLKYTKVRKVLFDFPTSEPLFYEEGDRVDDWGYGELTAADDVYLRHEVIFSSGATILIEFKHFTYERIRTRISSPWKTTVKSRSSN